jgi:hypothetical protein
MTQECEKCKRLEAQSARIISIIRDAAETAARQSMESGPDAALRFMMRELFSELGADFFMNNANAFREGRLS